MIKYPLCDFKIVSESDFNVLVNHYHNGSEISFVVCTTYTINVVVLRQMKKMHMAAIPLATVMILAFVLVSNPVLSAHTFSENENVLFLTMMDNIKATVGRDFSNNAQQAQEHAKIAASMLTQNDPIVNTTWASEISERNPRVATDLLHSLNDLNTIGASSSSLYNSTSVQSKVTNIGNLLDEAVFVRTPGDFK